MNTILVLHLRHNYKKTLFAIYLKYMDDYFGAIILVKLFSSIIWLYSSKYIYKAGLYIYNIYVIGINPASWKHWDISKVAYTLKNLCHSFSS